MKRYYKDNKLVIKPKLVYHKGQTYLNPSDETLIKIGYKIVEEEYKAPTLTNDVIKEYRKSAYKSRADQYFIAYQAYTELGELDKAKEMKKLWILEREAIDKQYPYIEE